MTSNTRLYIILGLITLSVVLLVAVTHEYRPVVHADWKASYELDGKDPYDMWLFKELIEAYMPGAEQKEGFPASMADEGALYIRVAERGSIGIAKTDSLGKYLHAGNHAFIIADRFSGGIDSFFRAAYHSYSDYSKGMMSFNFANDSLKRAEDYSYINYNLELDTLNKTHRNFIFRKDRDYDEGLNTDIVYDNTTWTYEYDDEYYNEEDSIELVEPPVTASDYNNYEEGALIVKLDVGDNGGSIYYCSLPELFTNITLQQPDMALFMDKFVTTLPSAKTIYWDNSEGIYVNNVDSESPLRFVMSQKSLRLGYFMLLGLALLFMIFRSKRRQKIIPLREKNKNTSLEYIDTLSKLYLSSGQHNKLVKHHEKIFYHEVERQFFIRKDHPDFVGVLAKKSRQPEEDILKLQARFKAAHEQEVFSIYQLQKVTERINTILDTQ